jgi:hypothetical protein
MKTTTLAAILASSLLVISCGKKDDLQTKEDNIQAQHSVKPVVLGENEVGTCTKCDVDMTLTKKEVKEAIDATNKNTPMFDSGIRPSSSK